MSTSSDKLFQRGQELKLALEQHQLELYLQPQYATRTGYLVGAECLLRWNHPTEGVRHSSDFLDVAQRSGLSLPLTAWTLYAAGALQQALNSEGVHIALSLNFSGLQVRQEQFISMVRKAIENGTVNPAHLYFEMDEATLAPVLGSAKDLVASITQLGIAVTLDDFGGGSMGIQRLKDLQIQKVRITPSFSAGIGQVPSATATAKALVDLAHALDIQVGLKEIETVAQTTVLLDIGADEMQGFAFSKPLPLAEFLALVASRPASA